MTEIDTEITCNMCGKKFDFWDTQENLSIITKFGYGTKYDGDKLKLHLCCSCMEKLIEWCIVSPVVQNT